MRDDKNFIHELDLILELNDQIIGQVMFVKTCLKVKENDIEVLRREIIMDIAFADDFGF